MKRSIILMLVVLFAGCANLESIEKLEAYPELYTLHNLHPDMKNNRLYTVNYQQQNLLIPVCTKVRLTDYGKKRVTFVAEPDNRQYHYFYYKRVREPLVEHIPGVFGPECPKKEIAALSEIDRKGIKKGVALPGMTKQGVLYAMGKPPIHMTPSTQSQNWMYWANRWKRFVVVFDENDLVERIQR